MTSKTSFKAMLTDTFAAVKNSNIFFITSILLASGCHGEGDSGDFVVSAPYALCASTHDVVSTSLKSGIDAVKGDIWVGSERAEIIIDQHAYYPVRDKVKPLSSSATGITQLDSGRYMHSSAGEEREFNLSAYRLKDGRNIYIVLSGASERATPESLQNIQNKLCVCGTC